MFSSLVPDFKQIFDQYRKKETFLHLGLLARRLLIILLMFSVCRLLFLIFNFELFEKINPLVFFAGIAFDISAICFLNIPFVIFSLLPFTFRNQRPYKHFLKILFYLFNSVGLGLNFIDIEYFKFTLKRSTADLLTFVGTGDDVSQLLPVFLRDFWYLILLFIITIFVIEFLYRRTQKKYTPPRFSIKYFLVHLLILIVGAGLIIIGTRGGIQLRPLSIVNASKYTNAQNIPLVLNTPFTILKTIGKPPLEEKEFFPPNEINKYYTPVNYYKDNSLKEKLPNIVVIILESFSKEFIGFLNNNDGYTPFLDSLSNYSHIYTNAFANGRKSVECLPSILAGIPSLMNNPYIFSPYSGNNIDALPNILEDLGYNTSFYHGATNGSMGFDGFCQVAGIKNYFGRKEFKNDKFYDGQWGIWDEEFFDYFLTGLNNKKEPFFSSIFSLTSHHPFKIPERYKEVFPEGKIPIHKTVLYTDYALKKFFNKASKQPWFKNTLFIITADHSTNGLKRKYKTMSGFYSIPLLFYIPNITTKQEIGILAKQTDIPPTILDYIGYNKPFITFGESLLRKNDLKFCVNFIGNQYYFITKNHLMQYDGKETKTLFNHRLDTLFQNNLVNSHKDVVLEYENKLKAFIQSYNSRIIHNNLVTSK